MRIKILGIAAAEGVPAPFCGCPMCEYARNNRGKEIRKRSSVMIDKNIVIDFGPDLFWSSVTEEICLDSVLYIFISHSHFDHLSFENLILASKKYRRTRTREKGKRTLIGSKSVYFVLQNYIEMMGCEDFWEFYEFRMVFPYEKLQLGEYTVVILPSNHTNKEQSLLFLITKNGKTFFYGTDTTYYSVREVFERIMPIKIDVVLSDCTYGTCAAQSRKGRHMGLPDNIYIRQEMINVGVISQESTYMLSHFSHDSLLPYEQINSLAQDNNMLIAYDGLTIEI